MRNLSRLNVFWLVLVLLVLFLLVVPQEMSPGPQQVPFSVLMQKVEEGQVREVTIAGQSITGKFDNNVAFTSTGPELTEGIYNDFVEHGVTPNFEERDDQAFLWNLAFMLLPIIAMVGLFVWFMRSLQGTNGRAMSFGKSRAKLHSDTNRRITFEDVAGIDESKDELQEIIEFLKDPQKFRKLGGRIPRGVLLMGSPGTGKTLLGRAVAGEAGVPFYSISGSDFVEMFVGVGASRVRDLFEQAKKNAPCIVFIDEIDAVGRHRGNGMGGGHDEREQTLNQLLVEMDGFEGTEGVIVMAATNRPDVLDAALLRPGRFDRRVTVPSPDVRGRQKILEIHTRKIPISTNVDLEVIAKMTPRFSGADLENLCNEAALLAARQDKKQVEMIDFEKARDKIHMGPERKSMNMPEKEKTLTAYHEAGHAIVAHLLPGHDPVHKVTIVPRGPALGVTAYLPIEDQHSYTKEALYRMIASAMGGRAAEEIAFSTVTSGAASDIEHATKIARHMVCDLGMSDDLGPLAWGERQENPFLGQMQRAATYSEETAQRIDADIRHIVQKCNDLAKRILTLNAHVLHSVAQSLVERETLDSEEFARLVHEAGPVPVPGTDMAGVLV